jgi:hypothetical protein
MGGGLGRGWMGSGLGRGWMQAVVLGGSARSWLTYGGDGQRVCHLLLTFQRIRTDDSTRREIYI